MVFSDMKTLRPTLGAVFALVVVLDLLIGKCNPNIIKNTSNNDKIIINNNLYWYLLKIYLCTTQ